VWVVTGDGDGLSIGGNHLLHTIRRNIDIQILLFNNRVYGLTKGQYSPTSQIGMRTRSTPDGSIDHPIDPLAFALGAGATFVARAVDVGGAHLQELLRRAHDHPGTALIEILQNCPVYNDNEWIEVEDRKSRIDAALVLKDGEPLVYGSEGQRRGIGFHGGIAGVIELENDEDPIAAGVAVHNERYETPAYAFALASLKRPEFPLPIGVFRAVETATYDALLQGQVAGAVVKHGAGSLHDLLHSGETWTVEST
jgi:2-oxoglutarate ferredoxin oxidoreductase subunit beta